MRQSQSSFHNNETRSCSDSGKWEGAFGTQRRHVMNDHDEYLKTWSVFLRKPALRERKKTAIETARQAQRKERKESEN